MNYLIGNFCERLHHMYLDYFHPEMKNPLIPPTGGTCHLKTLPNDLIIQIFKGLDDQTLQNSFGLNKKINEVMKSEEFRVAFIKERWLAFENLYQWGSSDLKTKGFFKSFLSYAYQDFVEKFNATYLVFIQKRVHAFVKNVIDDASDDYTIGFPELATKKLWIQNIVHATKKVTFMKETIDFLITRKDLTNVLDIQQFLSFIPFHCLPFIVLRQPDAPLEIKIALFNEIDDRFILDQTVTADQIKQHVTLHLIQALSDNQDVISLVDKFCSPQLAVVLRSSVSEVGEKYNFLI